MVKKVGTRIYCISGEQTRSLHRFTGYEITTIAKLNEESFKSLVRNRIKCIANQDLSSMIEDEWEFWFEVITDTKHNIYTFADDNGYYVYACENLKTLKTYDNKWNKND